MGWIRGATDRELRPLLTADRPPRKRPCGRDSGRDEVGLDRRRTVRRPTTGS